MTGRHRSVLSATAEPASSLSAPIWSAMTYDVTAQGLAKKSSATTSS